ncbi:hypothetical protein RHMOL_Rhmol03G0026800 [Rhododendron molle]|uniref:Uncharacterized protein n=1 Tax=Rhododendron molle TaxID=49168 RepID=A0ACC0P9D9_RHOML|nr:hypothetical protein RHMOL_Rhmol03G0026800 [Rhododendron molle]
MAATNYSCSPRIALDRMELHLAALNCTWPRIIALGSFELYMAAWNCTWPRQIERPNAILGSQVQFKANSKQIRIHLLC